MLLSHKNAVADAQVLDQVAHRRFHIEADLEVSATMLLCRLFVLVRNDKVVHNALYRCRFLVQIALVLFDTLFAAEVDATVTQILLLAIDRTAHRNPLHVIRALTAPNRVLRTGPLGFVADQTKSIDLYFLALDERG